MTDREVAVTPYLNGNAGLAGGPGLYHDDVPVAEDFAVGSSSPLVSAAYLMAAIRRSALFCCVMAFVGLLVGAGLFVTRPAPYQASTTLLLTDGPYENGTGSAADDQAIAQSRTVAALAMKRLGLQGSVDSFLKAYVITVASQRVLVITFSAPSADAAVNGANAVGAELLRFRDVLLVQQEEQVFAALRQQINQARQKLSAIRTQISQELVQPASPAQQLRLRSLRTESTNATNSLTSDQQALASDEATVQSATEAAIKGSHTLDAGAPLPRAHLRRILEYPVAGLIAGLAIAVAIVMIRAIVSDRLRRRDDVADALGAPVRLSTGPLRRGRLPASILPGRAAAARSSNIGRIATHLGRVISDNDRRVDHLAVVAVDDPEAAAMPLVSLATSCAQQGKRVVLADLASGSPAARMLGTQSPGVSMVDPGDARLLIAVPDPDDVTPYGPLGRPSAWDQHSPFSQAVAAGYASADLMLTLLTLDPSLGGEHLPTWAADAVVIVTAGRSTWTKVNAVGEMVRLSGSHLVSAVLVGADATDESLGAVPRVSREAEVMGQVVKSDGSGLKLR